MPYRVGVIGYGLSAKIFHIPYLQSTPEFKLQAICQRRASPENDAACDHPTVQIVKDSHELIQSPEVDIVILCTPPTSHLTLGKQCLEAGKHIVVEKPFCPTSAECDELIACAAKHGKLLSVYHNRRWDADYQTLLALLQKNTLGRIVEFESHFDRWSPNPETNWRGENLPGQGVVYDLGSHLIDQIVFAFGLPRKITGFLHQQRMQTETDVEDGCTILMHYDGMLAAVKASALSAENNQLRYLVRGHKGSFKKFDVDPQELQLQSGMRVDHPGFGKESSDKFGVLSLVEGNAISEHRLPTLHPQSYSAFYRDLVKALDTSCPVPVEGEAARNVIRLIELARQSAHCGQTLEVCDI